MTSPDEQIIDALGGTTAVSRLTETPLSTVHSWRKKGIPRSRLAHLRLVAQTLSPVIDVDAIASAAQVAGSSPGKTNSLSDQVPA